MRGYISGRLSSIFGVNWFVIVSGQPKLSLKPDCVAQCVQVLHTASSTQAQQQCTAWYRAQYSTPASIQPEIKNPKAIKVFQSSLDAASKRPQPSYQRTTIYPESQVISRDIHACENATQLSQLCLQYRYSLRPNHLAEVLARAATCCSHLLPSAPRAAPLTKGATQPQAHKMLDKTQQNTLRTLIEWVCNEGVNCMERMQARDIALMTLALGRLKYVHPPVLKAIDFRVSCIKEDISPLDLLDLLQGLAMLRVQPSDETCTTMQGVFMSNVHVLEVQQMVTVLESFNQIQEQPSRSVVSSIVSEVHPLMATTHPALLVRTFIALRAAKYCPPKPWLMDLERSVQNKLHVVHPIRIAQLLYSLPHVHYTPNKWFVQEAVRQLRRSIGSVTPREVAVRGLLWAEQGLKGLGVSADLALSADVQPTHWTRLPATHQPRTSTLTPFTVHQLQDQFQERGMQKSGEGDGMLGDRSMRASGIQEQQTDVKQGEEQGGGQFGRQESTQLPNDQSNTQGDVISKKLRDALRIAHKQQAQQ